MSCRSTPLSSAMTSYAKFLTPYFSEAQVQSLYHELKAEAADKDGLVVEKGDYIEFLDKLAYQIRNDETLSEKRKNSLLGRVEAAYSTEQVDEKTWYAVSELSDKVSVARVQYEQMLEVSATSFGLSTEQVHDLVVEARGGSWDNTGAFDDYLDYPEEFRFDLRPGLPRDIASQRAFRKLGYETFLAQPYPVFVYGTLRQGQGNNRVVHGGALAYKKATIAGIGVYGAHRGFPYAAEHDSAFTIGEVVWLSDDAAGTDARQSMDWLEGFNSNRPQHSHYERRRMTATFDDGVSETVWVYLARGSSRSQLQEYDLIREGDWVAAKNAYRDPSYIRSMNLGL